MNLNQPITMGNIFKSLNLFKKVIVTIFLAMIIVYIVLSVKFIFS